MDSPSHGAYRLLDLVELNYLIEPAAHDQRFDWARKSSNCLLVACFDATWQIDFLIQVISIHKLGRSCRFVLARSGTNRVLLQSGLPLPVFRLMKRLSPPPSWELAEGCSLKLELQ